MEMLSTKVCLRYRWVLMFAIYGGVFFCEIFLHILPPLEVGCLLGIVSTKVCLPCKLVLFAIYGGGFFAKFFLHISVSTGVTFCV